MSLSSAKAKLDAQGGDPVTGYISKTDHQESYDELVDDTALTGATTAEALDVTGALTAGTIASDATVAGTGLAGGLLSSANPVINGVAAPGTSAIPSRQDHVHAIDTTRAPLASPTFTGTVTIPSGLVLGTVTHTEGSGSPQSVVTAPVGSTYIDTAATTGAVKWIKATGTGNTGWVVEYGDTGWRGVTTWTSGGVVTGASLHADSAPTAATAGGVYVRRVNGNVQLLVQGLTTTGTTPTIYSTGFLVAGWRMTNAFGNVPCSVNGNMRMVGNFVAGGSGLNAGGGLTGTTNWGVYDGHAMWPTNDAWPASLPGAVATLSVP